MPKKVVLIVEEKRGLFAFAVIGAGVLVVTRLLFFAAFD
jgi:hypothetical protein